MLRNWPIFALAFALIMVIGVSCYTDSGYQDKQNSAGNSSPTPSVSQASHTGQAAETAKHAPFWRRVFAWPEGVTALAILLTLFFIGWQAMLMRQSVLGSEDSSKRELRAYLAVVVGDATFQERRERPKEDLKFEGRPLLVNAGRTPAHKIKFKARAAILPVPLPRELNLPETYDLDTGESVLGAGHQANMFAVVEGFCQDSEVAKIKDGTGDKGFYVWGLVTYEDVFGDEHTTRFCQQLHWATDGPVRGLYISGRNDAT